MVRNDQTSTVELWLHEAREIPDTLVIYEA